MADKHTNPPVNTAVLLAVWQTCEDVDGNFVFCSVLEAVDLFVFGICLAGAKARD